MTDTPKCLALFEASPSHSEFFRAQLLFLGQHHYRVHLWIPYQSPYELPASFDWVTVHRFTAASFRQRWVLIQRLVHFLNQHRIGTLVINTAHGSLVRDLVLRLLLHPVRVVGILHFGEKIAHGSLTQRLISLKINQYFVLAEYILPRVQRAAPRLRFAVLHYLTYHPPTHVAASEGLELAIPGNFEPRRRDYEGLIEWVDQHQTQLARVRFVLLASLASGAPGHGERVWRTIRDRQLEPFFEKFDYYLSDEEMNRRIAQSDAVMPLLHPRTADYGLFSQFAVSGAFNLAFSFRKPLLMYDQDFTDYPIFREVSFFYTMDSLLNLLTRLATHKHQLADKARAYDGIEAFAFEHQSASYVRFIERATPTLSLFDAAAHG